MKLLAIVAHLDDAEIFCGGILAKHADRGDDVTVAYMTCGELGGFETTEEAVAATREEEAKRAAEILGVDAVFLDFLDGRISYSMENRLCIVDVLRKHAPDIVLTHYRDDMHPDHHTTSRLVTDAYYMASLPLVETAHPTHDPDNVYFFGKPTSSFTPDVVIDISDYQETKETATLQHDSQVEWLEEHGGIDAEFNGLLDGVRAEALVLGKTAGVEFAEGFQHTMTKRSSIWDRVLSTPVEGRHYCITCIDSIRLRGVASWPESGLRVTQGRHRSEVPEIAAVAPSKHGVAVR